MANPLVTVVMPVYNAGTFIAEAIQSILSQNYKEFEFIIISDGSTDNSAEVIQSFSDSRILFINNKENRGNYVCRNIGCRLAKGKYICVMDSDDFSMPKRIELQVEALEKDDTLLANGSFFRFSSGVIGTKPSNYDYIKLALLRNNMFLHPSLMIRKNALESVGYYDESYYYSSDYDLACKLALKGKIINIPEVLMVYRLHHKQISSAHKKQQCDYANQIRLKYLYGCGFELSDEEKVCFTNLMFNTRISNRQIHEIELLVLKLQKENFKKQLFDCKAFNAFTNIVLSNCYLRLEN